jgi:hypothetical protein
MLQYFMRVGTTASRECLYSLLQILGVEWQLSLQISSTIRLLLDSVIMQLHCRTARGVQLSPNFHFFFFFFFFLATFFNLFLSVVLLGWNIVPLP